MENFNYSGNELDLFSEATNWKSYWSNNITKYLGDSVLEVGAGIGCNTEIFSGKRFKRWVAIEPDFNFCSVIRLKIKKKILPRNIEVFNTTLPKLKKSEYFNTILYIDVLEHIENDKEELRIAQSHLMPNGHIIIIAPAHNFLYTSFDKKIGHYRRYNKNMLRSIAPSSCKIVNLRYLDSVGIFASIVNKLFLKSDSPSISQVLFWDKFMVRMSTLSDRLLGYILGKSIVCVLKKNEKMIR